jgi:hypothetical protein
VTETAGVLCTAYGTEGLKSTVFKTTNLPLVPHGLQLGLSSTSEVTWIEDVRGQGHEESTWAYKVSGNEENYVMGN